MEEEEIGTYLSGHSSATHPPIQSFIHSSQSVNQLLIHPPTHLPYPHVGLPIEKIGEKSLNTSLTWASTV